MIHAMSRGTATCRFGIRDSSTCFATVYDFLPAPYGHTRYVALLSILTPSGFTILASRFPPRFQRNRMGNGSAIHGLVGLAPKYAIALE